MKVGLVLGGGGLVGAAWEIAVLAGIKEACGFDASSADVIIGTSAGSVVGAYVAQGRDLDELCATQAADTTSRAGTTEAPDLMAGPSAEIFRLLLSPEGQTPEGVARIAELAADAPTVLTEDAFLDSFRRSVASEDWPDADLRVTTTSCRTGKRVVWDRTSGIDLNRAVASSCAIPGFYPTVSFGGDRFMDGPRGKGYNAAILEPEGVDAVLFVGPKLGSGGEHMMESELGALAALGPKMHAITGGEEFQAANFNLMDPLSRRPAVDIGRREGRAEAEAVARILG